jgi:hypothetical protein
MAIVLSNCLMGVLAWQEEKLEQVLTLEQRNWSWSWSWSWSPRSYPTLLLRRKSGARFGLSLYHLHLHLPHHLQLQAQAQRAWWVTERMAKRSKRRWTAVRERL